MCNMRSVEALETKGTMYSFDGSRSKLLRTAEDHPIPGVSRVAYPGLVMAYSGIEVGNVDYRFIDGIDEESGQPGDIGSVLANRQKLLRSLPITRYVLQRVKLGGDFEDLSAIEPEDLQSVYETDGLITDRPGIALGLNPADCAPMVIFDKEATVLGLIHVGRQGIDSGIHVASVNYIQDTYDVKPEDVRVYFGPAIHEKSYHYPGISAEQLADPKWSAFINRRRGNYHIDTLGRAVNDLAEAGIDPSTQIAISSIDTASDKRYFSHVRSKHTGEPIGRNGFSAVLVD